MTAKAPQKPRLAGVVGWPVAHSLSPLIHSTWAAREGANARYDAIAVEPDDEAFRKRIDELCAEGYAGVNVTIPHKERALKFADSASAAAKTIGAANMLTFRANEIHAENSDAVAVEAIIRNLERPPVAALVLGAGGAARAVLFALKRAGAATIILANRTRSRAEEIAPIAAAEAIDWADRNARLGKTDLVINTTSLGMKGEPPLDIDHDCFQPGAVVFDIVYAPLETALIKAARVRGLKTIDGLEMLMRQAVPGYLAWLGDKADVDADLRARLEAALRARGA